jgi:predicted TIM-barrel fold metal-dependent hydrolase
VFIDIHVHAYRAECPPGDGRTQFATPRQILARYDELGIERGVLLPLIGPEVYLPQSNEDILDMAAAAAGRFIPFCNIDPRGISNSPDAALDCWLSHYKQRGCKGIGELMPNLPFVDPRVQNLFRHAETLQMPIIFDISDRIGGDYGLYDDPGLPQLELSLKRFPRLAILGHGPAFWAEIGTLDSPADRAGYPQYPVRAEGAVPRLFRECPNLYGDLSAGSGYNALARDPDYAVTFLSEFQDRMLFGTDLCTAEQPAPIVDFLTGLRDAGKLGEDVFRKIARQNAVRLLQLDD